MSRLRSRAERFDVQFDIVTHALPRSHRQRAAFPRRRTDAAQVVPIFPIYRGQNARRHLIGNGRRYRYLGTSLRSSTRRYSPCQGSSFHRTSSRCINSCGSRADYRLGVGPFLRQVAELHRCVTRVRSSKIAVKARPPPRRPGLGPNGAGEADAIFYWLLARQRFRGRHARRRRAESPVPALAGAWSALAARQKTIAAHLRPKFTRPSRGWPRELTKTPPTVPFPYANAFVAWNIDETARCDPRQPMAKTRPTLPKTKTALITPPKSYPSFNSSPLRQGRTAAKPATNRRLSALNSSAARGPARCVFPGTGLTASRRLSAPSPIPASITAAGRPNRGCQQAATASAIRR